ncbi:MAG: cobyrinate a,c-diamide synthase, partial [Thermodesulfobacteriota bacterium]|nr:cobyrinate a,c-diamide synthase [Thermodesulfobacteriota bacterium]
MKRHLPRLIIAGLRGSSGKTMISIGLIAALSDKGIKIAPFKKGPDYIDSGWLAKAAGKECYNLDVYLIGEKNTSLSFSRNSEGMDLAFIEGNRGLFDGFERTGKYSTAELSKLLSAPVVLVVDCTKATRTVAALILGCQSLDKKLSIRGVILNQIANSRHEKIIREVIESECRIPVLGAIRKLKDFDFPMRHLGLVPHHEHSHPQEIIGYLSGIINDSIDLDKFLKIARSAPYYYLTDELLYQEKKPGSALQPTIGVIMDTAFQFYYPENINFLKNFGAKIVIISALEHKSLPSLDA